MSLPEYRFTSTELADYLDKARPMMILAERERCAKIADDFARANSILNGNETEAQIASATASAIAAQIRVPKS